MAGLSLITKGYLEDSEITVTNEFVAELEGVLELSQELEGTLITEQELTGIIECE